MYYYEKKWKEVIKDESLRNRIREEEITINCRTTYDELLEKELALSFVLQGYVYILPLDLLFAPGVKTGEIEMVVKIIDDNDAIWNFGYPFMNQLLMIFNMEESYVGIKKLKKTVFPIISVYEEWEKLNLKDSNSSAFKIIGIIDLILVVLAALFLAYRAIRKKNHLIQMGPLLMLELIRRKRYCLLKLEIQMKIYQKY